MYRFTDIGWLRLGGSLKSLVSFAKETYKRDDILQQRPVILRILPIVATPYVYWGFVVDPVACVQKDGLQSCVRAMYVPVYTYI